MKPDVLHPRKAMFEALLSLCLGTTVFAADGKITGRVLDKETREPIPGVNVVVARTILSDGSEVPLDRVLGGATDADGYYFILNVAPGLYSVDGRIIGYIPVSQRFVKVDLDRTVAVDFELSPTSIEVGTVVVEARREIIKQDVSATQEVIVTARLEQMPVLRMDEFVGRVKGVELISTNEGNGLSVRGGGIRETDVRLDGISLQDPRTENSYLALNSTAIQEIQVLTGGFQAKYGGIRSGLLNVVTKDGQRDWYTLSIKVDVTPSNQKRFFGTNPWSDDSWIYKVYSGDYAMKGVRTNEDFMAVPYDFWSFKGWDTAYTSVPDIRFLTPDQRVDLWRAQHPKYAFANKPDYFVEGSITGPLPGSFVPLFDVFADRTTFLLGFKYENSQLAFPIGPRDNYVDWNSQLKLTTSLSDRMRLSVNGMYAKVSTLSTGRTTSYGGALVDQASSFGFLNSTESSVRQQAGLIGGGSFNQIFNKSRPQYYDQRYEVGGAKLTHTISNIAFYTLDFQFGYTDQRLKPFSMDTSVASNFVYYDAVRRYPNGTILDTLHLRFYVPTFGSPNASTNYGFDALNTFTMFGGPQRVDSSYSYVYQLKGDMTMQIGRHHQLETGFSARYQDMLVYSGTWFQSQLSYTPDTWQYYKAHPLEIGAYVQDKLEFEGMILNAGVRLDYLNPLKEGFVVAFPLDDDYQKLYGRIYPNLPGNSGSYERWEIFRSLLEDPPGWDRVPDKVQLYLSPRMGVSFPITEASKLYFNYGHFYQRPPIAFMYNLYLTQGSVMVPTPDLSMARTVSYEFGYEQMFLSSFLINVTAYYKDVRNEPLSRKYISYFKDNIVSKYMPDAYRDIRGIELRLERPIGEYMTFNAMYDYMLQSSGQSGLSQIFENRLLARDNELRSPNLVNTEPRPRANANINLHTPSDFGSENAIVSWLNNLYFNFFYEWRDGGRMLLNPEEPDVKLRRYIEALNYWNIDFRASKTFAMSFGSIEFVVTVKNLTNNKWLITDNMLQTQFSDYKNSLRTPDKGGDDKWGQYKAGDNHIKIGWWEAPIFLNPRRILMGLRLNF